MDELVHATGAQGGAEDLADSLTGVNVGDQLALAWTTQRCSVCAVQS